MLGPVEFPASGTACQAQAQNLEQIQNGFWHRFHKGPEGTLQAGVSYSYTRHDTPGADGLAPRVCLIRLADSFGKAAPMSTDDDKHA